MKRQLLQVRERWKDSYYKWGKDEKTVITSEGKMKEKTVIISEGKIKRQLL